MTNSKTLKERVFITGAGGFVGAYLLHKLVKDKRFEVHVALRKKTNTWRIADILPFCHVHYVDLLHYLSLETLMKKIKPTVIYHLAAYGAYPFQTDAVRILETNTLGTWNLLHATRDIPYKLFINTGSSSEYGFKSKPMKETDLPEPASYYAVSKVASTLLCSYFAKSEHKPVVTFRLFSVYGPYEESTRLIPTLLMAILTKKVMKLVSPTIARDMVYVDDVANAYLSIDKLSKHGGEYFNIGTGIQSTMKAIVVAAEKVTKETTTYKWNTMQKRIWDTNVWVCNAKKATTFGWKAKTSLEKGLKLTWRWFQLNRKHYE